MYDEVRRDYVAMAGMIFGDAPAFDAIIETVADADLALNAVVEAI